MPQLNTFCMGCRKPIDQPLDARIEEVQNPKGNRYAIRGTCPECGTGQFKFVSKATYEEWKAENGQ